MPLLSANELGTLQHWATLGMTDSVTIQRMAQADTAFGDDEQTSYATIGTSDAWIRSTPTIVATADVGALVTINTYRLLVPVGTDITVKDQVLWEDEVFLVTDTTFESTWKPFLTVNLRRRE